MEHEYLSAFGILTGVLARFWPVWIALAIVLGASFAFRKRLGLYGELFGNPVGVVGVTICYFWLFTAIFAGTIAPFDPLGQMLMMKDALPGAIETESGQAYLFGGDRLARDIFSRTIYGSQIVLLIAPAATGFALMVGTTLGLPAGYYGGRIDSILSFLANLVLAFPVILLFYLLVTPGIMETPIPYAMAGLFFHDARRVGQTHRRQHVERAVIGLLLGDLLVDDRHFHQLPPDFHGRVQARHRLLIDHGDLVAANGAQLVIRHVAHVAALKHDPPADDLPDIGQVAHDAERDGRLPAP